MESIVNMVAQRAGISEDKAKTAVDTVVGFLKDKAPAGLSGQIDSLISGGGSGAGGGIASAVGGMFGGKEKQQES